MNTEDTQGTDAEEVSEGEKNDTEKVGREESLVMLLDEADSLAILERVITSHSEISHNTSEEDGVPETSQEKPVEDEKIESTPQPIVTKEDNIVEHGSDNPPSPSADRKTSEHENQDGRHDTNTGEQIATRILFADTLARSLNKRKIKAKERFKWAGSLQDLKSFVELILKRKGTWKGKKIKSRTLRIMKPPCTGHHLENSEYNWAKENCSKD